MNEQETGIPPRRIGGIDVIRLIPAVPEPLVTIPVSEQDEYDFLKWEALYGGTRPEYVCFRWLQRKGYKEFWDFQFQSSSMGGRQMAGGAVVDFEFPTWMLAWRVQGEKWHVGEPEKEAHDEMQKLSLLSLGYTVVDIFAEDALERPDWVLSNAIIGIQVRTLHGIQ